MFAFRIENKILYPIKESLVFFIDNLPFSHFAPTYTNYLS